MTVAGTGEPLADAGRGGVRWGLVVAVLIVVAVVGYLAFAGIGSALVYYLTPSELLARGEAARGATVRLGGLVEEGTLELAGGTARFVVTDGTARIPVQATAAPGGIIREGVGVVVEGTLGADGVFNASEVLVKHDETYVAPSPGEAPDGVYEPPD